MVDVIQEENTEDLLALSGVSSADGSDTVWESVRARAPWLGVNLFTAFIVSAIISLFEHSIEQIVALAVLMPVVAALGGNAGSQGLAVAVRAIAERELDGSAARRAVLREFLTGVVNGVIFAIGVGLIALAWFQDVKLSLVIAAAMLATFIWAGLSGILVPLTLKRLGADPAPFVPMREPFAWPEDYARPDLGSNLSRVSRAFVRARLNFQMANLLLVTGIPALRAQV
jgi:magnesium transporter